MKPLVDGHGRPIGDVRISVTDRCNFRCQYCMPAEGLPWLSRESLLSYEEIARLVALLSSMGVHDVRLTGGEPLVRKELWRLVEMLSGLEDVHDLSLTTNGYLLARQVDDLVRAGLKRINVSLDSLAPDRFFQLTRRDSLAQVLEGLEAAEAHPELRPIKVNVVALKDFTEDEVVRFADFARRTPYVVRFIEFMPLDADHSWSADKVLPNEEIRRLIHEVLSARGRRARPPRHLAALALRRRAGRDRLHLPRLRAVLRRLQPHPPDRRGHAAHLPVLAQRDRPARADARRRERRRARGRSSATPSGARSSSTTSATRASSSRRARCRASAGEGPPRGDRAGPGGRGAAARPSACRWPRRPAASPPRTGRSAVDLPPFDRSAMDGYAVRAADTGGGPLRLAGEVAAGETRDAPLEPGTALGITTGAPIPPGADAVLQSELARARRRHRARHRARSRPARHVRLRGEDVHAGDLIAPPASRSRSRASPRSPPPASARSPSTAARGCTCWSPARSCCRSARRPSRARSTSPTG